MTARLGRKRADAGYWRQVIAHARQLVPDRRLDPLLERTVEAVRAEARQGRVAYAWSGGKDSQALRFVMEAAGVHECVLGRSTGLEWPAMLRWQARHMPPGCETIALPLDLRWLRGRPKMLFPQGEDGNRWFNLIQHKAEAQYFVREGLDLLALGRRRADGNYVGPRGTDRYTNRDGITRWSPLADWSHEEVFSLILREGLAFAPCYDWPRGWQVGTGPWPARQWTRSIDHGFAECWAIDPNVIRQAAAVLPQAAAWMSRNGKT
jgi:3'-phosphoadenosine 5'-phosphosulfate sulfotransferase (PAPS reductase)/FAD synthetase